MQFSPDPKKRIDLSVYRWRVEEWVHEDLENYSTDQMDFMAKTVDEFERFFEAVDENKFRHSIREEFNKPQKVRNFFLNLLDWHFCEFPDNISQASLYMAYGIVWSFDFEETN